MSRYNPTVSKEETEIDANVNNPVLDSEFEPNEEPKDDEFELALPEDVDTGEKVKEIAESVASSEALNLGIEALTQLHSQMSIIVETEARMRPETARVFSASVEHLDMLTGYEGDSHIPSLESFDSLGLACASTQISVEGVLDRIDTAIGKFMYSIGRLANNLVGLSRSMTPVLDKIISDAKTLKGELNNAHRDAGQKEISAKNLSILTVDGKTPDASTVIKTVKYLNACSSEILTPKVIDVAEKYAADSLGLVTKALDERLDDKKGYVSGWMALFGLYGVIPARRSANNAMKQVSVDGSIFPGLFAIFPSVVKVNHSFENVKRNVALESKRSLPLFNDRAIVVSQFRSTVPIAAATRYTPAITIITLGGTTTHAKTIQSLKPTEQKIVLDELITLAEQSKVYFKTYGARSKGCYERFVKMYKSVKSLSREHTTTHKRFVTLAATSYVRFLNRAFWNGIFAEQSRIALYNRDVAKGLLRYVRSSSQAANGKPATESNDVGFDFD